MFLRTAAEHQVPIMKTNLKFLTKKNIVLFI